MVNSNIIKFMVFSFYRGASVGAGSPTVNLENLVVDYPQPRQNCHSVPF
jgi:hypothetical protein